MVYPKITTTCREARSLELKHTSCQFSDKAEEVQTDIHFISAGPSMGLWSIDAKVNSLRCLELMPAKSRPLRWETVMFHFAGSLYLVASNDAFTRYYGTP